jgi:glycosyltransferase involved in cell wall biosynthesis
MQSANFAERKIILIQTGHPLVSTIVLSYNQSQFVVETLESVKAQTYKATEFIIVDDCSTDDSVAIIERWLQENKIHCTFVRHDKNQGICKSLNDALAVVTGKYISMVASDDIWLPDKIARQVKLMESLSDQVGVLYSDAFRMDENGNTLPGMLIETGWKLTEMPQGQVLDVMLTGNFIPGLTALVRRSCYDEVGFYDENLPWEDWDMWMRIARRFAFFYSPIPSARYRVHEKSLSHCDPTRMLKDSFRVCFKQFRVGLLTETQKSTLTGTLLNFAEQLYRLDDQETPDLLLALSQATGDKRCSRMYWFVRIGLLFQSRRRVNLARDAFRVRFWHPVLNFTRPLRHALGLRQAKGNPRITK